MMPFLHLPVQAGSNKILKNMNRKHTREFYLELIKKIKEHIPDMAFSSDFIVGYPGETDLDFQETLDLIEKVKFASSTLKYSARPGTPASTKKIQVSEEVLNKRLKKIQAVLNQYQTEFNLSFLNRTVEVLFSGVGRKNNQFVENAAPTTSSCKLEFKYYWKTIEGKTIRLTAFSFHGKLVE